MSHEISIFVAPVYEDCEFYFYGLACLWSSLRNKSKKSEHKKECDIFSFITVSFIHCLCGLILDHIDFLSSPTVTVRVFSALCYTLEGTFLESKNFNSFVLLKY